MKKVISLLLVLLMMTVGLSACKKKIPDAISSDNPEVKAIEAVIYKGIEALNEEDVEKYMETCVLDEGDTGFTHEEYIDSFRAEVYDGFELLDLHYEVESITVTNLVDNRADVELVMTIEDTREGTTFQSVRDTNIMVMTKDSGEWLVDQSSVMYSEPLEEQTEPAQ